MSGWGKDSVRPCQMTPFGSSAGVPRRGEGPLNRSAYFSSLPDESSINIGSWVPPSGAGPIAHLPWAVLVLFSVRRAHEPTPAFSLYLFLCLSVPSGHLPSPHPRIIYGGMRGGGKGSAVVSCQSICQGTFSRRAGWRLGLGVDPPKGG